jgi:hypothetical protein
MEQLIGRLQKLGFRQDDAQQAVSMGFKTLAAALDWLCMHLPEELLPATYAAGAVANAHFDLSRLIVCVFVVGGGGGGGL